MAINILLELAQGLQSLSLMVAMVVAVLGAGEDVVEAVARMVAW